MKKIINTIKTDRFSTTIINLIYQFDLNNNEILTFTILNNLLISSNNKYKEEPIYAKEKLKRYIMKFICSSNIIGKSFFYNFSIIIPNKDIVNDIDLNDIISFIFKSIYEPNLNENLFEKEKRNYTEYLLNARKNIGFIAEINMLDLIDNNGKLNTFKYRDLDSVKKLEFSNIVDFYNKHIKTCKPKVFINGNINKKEIENTFNNNFEKYKLIDYKINTDYYNLYDVSEYKEKYEVANYYQSVVYASYRVKNISIDDIYKLHLINLLLSSSSSDILLHELRKKNNLVYTCSSSLLFKNGILLVRAITRKENIDKVIEVIKDIFDSFKNIEYYENNINNILYRIHLNILRKKDYQVSESSDLINSYYELDDNLEEELDILSSISLDDMKDFISRIQLNNIYVLKGERE